MRRDHHFVAEPVGPFHQIVQVRVAKFVNLVFAVAGGDEGQFQDDDLGIVNGGEGIEPFRSRIPQESDQRQPPP